MIKRPRICLIILKLRLKDSKDCLNKKEKLLLIVVMYLYIQDLIIALNSRKWHLEIILECSLLIMITMYMEEVIKHNYILNPPLSL